MTASKRGAGAKGTGASRASKAFTFRGVKLPAVAKLPDTLIFDLNDIQLRFESDQGGQALLTIQRMLEELLGRDELQKVRPTIKGPEDSWQFDLLKAILAPHGVELGEA